ncbi:MAG: ribonuclease III [Rhabdochlamydiaceae bacterium]
MQPLEQIQQNIDALQTTLTYSFKNQSLLLTACVHRSFLNENKQLVNEYNERLEFLGDSILGLLVSHYLYLNWPHCSEGELSHMRSLIVDAHTCAYFAKEIGVHDYLLLGKGERLYGKNHRDSILADFFEALIGAIYLDGGWEKSYEFFMHHLSHLIHDLLKEPSRNWKAELQDYIQKKYQQTPCYKLIKESGPDHYKTFEVSVGKDEEVWGHGVGFSKKEAEQKAAEEALKKLGMSKDG